MPPYKKLEELYARFVDTQFCVAVSSGTAALHLSLIALGVGPGDEVIVPDFTMAACGFAVSYCGAKVVTVDCDDDFNINVSKIEEKINERTKVIMGVHIYGRLCDMQAIRTLADKYNLKVLEDACEAQGATNGAYADCTVFSFYRNKIIHAEEGGAVCTNSKEIYDNIQDLKNMAFGDKHNYFHSRIGYNYRMTDSQANMAMQSLAEYPSNNEKRRAFERAVKSNLASVEFFPHDAVWVFDFLCASEDAREFVMKEWKHLNPRYFFKPLSTMPMWEQPVGEKALRYSQVGMYIPFQDLPGMV